MRPSIDERITLRQPQLLGKARQLDAYLKTLSPKQLAKTMHLSAPLANKTHVLIAAWTADPKLQTLALDCFGGDIYRGLRASEFQAAERDYADQTLRILSGLYGIIRPYDGVAPYRLEMGYKLPDPAFANLYEYWGDVIAACLPQAGLIVNLSSVEYARTVTPFVDPARIVAPEFLTVEPKTGRPTFVVVHAKIARGAFARWLIISRTEGVAALTKFTDLGYHYDEKLSTPGKPAFACQTFGGLGLSA